MNRCSWVLQNHVPLSLSAPLIVSLTLAAHLAADRIQKFSKTASESTKEGQRPVVTVIVILRVEVLSPHSRTGRLCQPISCLQHTELSRLFLELCCHPPNFFHRGISRVL